LTRRLETALVVWLNRFFSPPRFILHTEEAAKMPQQEKEAEEFRQSRDVFLRVKASARLDGGVVLDLACGSGIKTTSFAVASPEARLTVGIDVDANAVAQAQALRSKREVDRVAFVLADAAVLPFKDGSVDLVVSENAFEHVPNPSGTLREAARVLKDRGVLALRFFPLYSSRYGSHLWDYLCIPWVHVWASADAVAAAYRKIIESETPRLLREFAGIHDEEDIRAYVASQIHQFLTLNELTPRGFYRGVAATGGWRILAFAFHQTSRLGRLLAYLPGIDRFAVWGITCVLRRNVQATISPGAFLRFRWRSDLRAAGRKLSAWSKGLVGPRPPVG
jgi:ubiquinone/menaquinone biosynthesis C-methylase UbiE